MIEGGSSKILKKLEDLHLKKESEFQELIDILCESLINYLSLQIKAGADLIKFLILGQEFCQSRNCKNG